MQKTNSISNHPDESCRGRKRNERQTRANVQDEFALPCEEYEATMFRMKNKAWDVNKTAQY